MKTIRKATTSEIFFDLAARKAVFEPVFKRFLAAQANPRASQETVFLRRKRELAGTEVSKLLGMEKANSYSDYLHNIPTHDYSFFEPLVKRAVAGEKNILFRDTLDFLCITSGTSGFNSKVIPYNATMIATCFAMQKKLHAASMARFPEVRPSSTKLLLGARPVIDKVNGIPRGYISGALSKQAPEFIRRRYFPSEVALSIDDWSEKVAQIALEARDVDVQLAGGVPSHLLNLFKDLLEHTGASSISELWPSLQYVVFSGTPIENYESALDKLAGRKLNYIGAYISTEAPIGLELPEAGRTKHELVLNVDDLLLSFRDVDSPQGRIYGIHELQAGGEYLINTGTPNGLLQYEMKDYIKVTEVSPYIRCQVQGRYGSALNIATEKVSHNEVLQAVSLASKQAGIPIEHFFVYPKQDLGKKPRYEWVFAVNNPDIHMQTRIQASIDEMLMNVSLDYREARLEGLHIDAATVRLIPSEVTQQYFKRNSNRGQFKPKTSFGSDTDFHSFCHAALPEMLQFVE